ncbi:MULTISPECIES: hypothetical protein [Hyphomonas]|uniref:hypothetical protein n=1 Tax=Hyphomonas TaxID=85 RepID=UPI003001816A
MSPVVIGILLAFVIGVVVATWKAPRLTGAIWWSLLATILCSAALLLSLPFDFGQLALWLTLAVPVIWMAFMFLCYWDASRWRVPVCLIALSAVSATVITLVPPPTDHETVEHSDEP